MKAIQESVDQTEQSRMEFATLEQLREQEVGAIVRRTEVCLSGTQFSITCF